MCLFEKYEYENKTLHPVLKKNIKVIIGELHASFLFYSKQVPEIIKF